jgi:hypothetical protein
MSHWVNYILEYDDIFEGEFNDWVVEIQKHSGYSLNLIGMTPV